MNLQASILAQAMGWMFFLSGIVVLLLGNTSMFWVFDITAGFCFMAGFALIWRWR